MSLHNAIWIGAFFLCLFLFMNRPVVGQEHIHPDATFPDALGQFYGNWMRPDSPMQSCCNRKDCSPVAMMRMFQGRWQAQSREGFWLNIPPEKVEKHRDSPDGRSHLCSIGLSVICFVFGSGT